MRNIRFKIQRHDGSIHIELHDGDTGGYCIFSAPVESFIDFQEGLNRAIEEAQQWQAQED